MERVFRCRAVTTKAKIKVTLNREEDVSSVGPTVAHQLNFLIILTSSNFWILIDIKIWASRSRHLKEEIFGLVFKSLLIADAEDDFSVY